MPEIFRKYGFIFFFYSREHEPIHVHVAGENGVVIYDLVNGNFIQRDIKGRIKASSIKKIELTLHNNKDLVIETWNRYFDLESDENDNEEDLV